MVEIPKRLEAALADRYTIERELGRGGMAIVYLAQDLRHERWVALKVLHPEPAACRSRPSPATISAHERKPSEIQGPLVSPRWLVCYWERY